MVIQRRRVLRRQRRLVCGSRCGARLLSSRPRRNALVAELLQRKFPQEIGQRTAEENFGIGTFRDFPVACPVIEVAGDGQTAKGLWYCWGSQAQVLSCGPTASWTWGYYAADFVREGNGWKLWHLQITNDVDARCGTDWGQPAQPLPELPEFAPLKDFAMPAYSMADPTGCSTAAGGR